MAPLLQTPPAGGESYREYSMKLTFYAIAMTVLGTALLCSCQKDSSSPSKEVLLSTKSFDISEQELKANILTLVSFGTRNTYSTKTSKTQGIGAAQAWLEEKFRALSDGDQFRPFTNCFTSSGNKLCNVGGILKGSVTPEKFFVISGHYDSMPSSSRDGTSDAPGADDDASGTSVVLEAARVLSRQKVAISVIFLATVGEEQGLLGSRHFAQQMKKQGVNIVGMITNDIVGSSNGTDGSAPNRLRCYSDWNGKYTSGSKILARKVSSAVAEGTKNQFTLELRDSIDRPGRSGDHVAFLEQGFPAIRFIEPYEDLNHQHQNVRTENGTPKGDLPEYLEYDYMARVVLANVLAVLSI